MPIIRPRPRTSASSSYVSVSAASLDLSRSPVARAFATICSFSMTDRTARLTAIAWALDPKLAECTSTRSIEE